MATYSNAPPGESDRLPNKLIPMVMHKPPHPGEFIEGVYLEPCALSIRQVADISYVRRSELEISVLCELICHHYVDEVGRRPYASPCW